MYESNSPISPATANPPKKKHSYGKYIYAGSAVAGAAYCGIQDFRKQRKYIKAIKDAGIKDIVELSKHETLGQIGYITDRLAKTLMEGKIHFGNIAKSTAFGSVFGVVASLFLGLPFFADIFSSSETNKKS